MIELLLLGVRLPGQSNPILGGFVVIDREQTFIRFRRDWTSFCDAGDAEVLNGMEDTLLSMAASSSSQIFAESIENLLSNTVFCLDRLHIPTTSTIARQVEMLTDALVPE